jgi:hypothetical protein
MSEWFKEAVLKTVVLLARDRGFESYSLRQEGQKPKAENFISIRPRRIRGEMAELAEGARLLSGCTP